MDTKPQGKKYLTAAEILAATDISTIEIDIPQWGGTIRFRALSAAEAIEFQAIFKDEDEKQDAIIRLFAVSAVDEGGSLLFPHKNNVYELRKKSMAAFLKVQKKLLEFNGFTEKGAQDAKNG